MTFVRIKHIKTKGGKIFSYVYLCKNYWNKELKQARQRVVMYMGRAEELEPFIVKEIFEKEGYSCKNCSRQDTLTIDHIIPTSKGGTNDLSNLQVLCERCNKKKGNTISKLI